MAALVTNSVGTAIQTPTAPGVPDTNVSLPVPRPGDVYRIIVGATATTITINRYGNFPSGTAKPDEVLTSISNTERRIPVIRDYVDPSTGVPLVNFSQTTNVTAELIRTGA